MRWRSSALLALILLAAAPHSRRDADVIVVGAGLAGLSAALEAARGGAAVIVVDTSSVFGGHAVMSGGHVAIVDTPLQRARHIHDSPALAAHDFLAYGGDADRGWVELYSRRSRREIYDFLTGLGIRFDDIVHYPGNSVPRQHAVHGEGLGLVAPIYRACLAQKNIRFLWKTRVTELLRDGERVVGVRAGAVELRADTTILATGGFQSNLDLVRANWPKTSPLPERILAGSGINSTGSGLMIAKNAGAALTRLDHQWNYETGIPDPRYPGANRGVNGSVRGGIWVNSEGKRFVDERLTRRERLAALLRQPGATYWLIFDQSLRPDFWIAGTDWADRARVDREILDSPAVTKKAATVAGLARVTGLPPDALARSMASLHSPPFYAIESFPLARKSMGGVRIDHSCRVLDVRGRVIPGLYAAGEVAGFGGINGIASLEGTFLGTCILTGRIAARGVRTSPSARLPPQPPPRPGGWHYDVAHRNAGACATCHEKSGAPPTIESCSFCHGRRGD